MKKKWVPKDSDQKTNSDIIILVAVSCEWSSQNDNWVQCLNWVPVTFGHCKSPGFFEKGGEKKKKKPWY
jgi:hypothetical protein